MKRFWQWLTRPFRRKKKPTVPDHKRMNFHSLTPSHRDSDFVDGMLTYMVVDSALNSFVGTSDSVDVPSQPAVEVAEKEYVHVVTPYTEPAPVFNDTSSFTMSSSPASVDEDSLLTTVFSGIGDAVSGVGEAIGSALSD